MIKIAEEKLNLINGGARYKIKKAYSQSWGLATYHDVCGVLTGYFNRKTYEEVMRSISKYDTTVRLFFTLFAEVEDGRIVGCKPYEQRKIFDLINECRKNPNLPR